VPPAEPGLSESLTRQKVNQNAALDSANTPGPVSSDIDSMYSSDCETA
jgi:hypothetical protein